jgi:hypothetical protein
VIKIKKKIGEKILSLDKNVRRRSAGILASEPDSKSRFKKIRSIFKLIFNELEL